MSAIMKLFIPLSVLFFLAAATGARADLLEWKKMEFQVAGPDVPAAKSMDELRSMFADPLVCSGCHPSQYEAWSKSFHARSIGNAGFQALYLKYLDYLKMEETVKTLGRPASAEELRQCLFCHAPQVQYATDKLVEEISTAVVSGRWDEIRGVQISCVACHSLDPAGKWVTDSFSGKGTMFGPINDPDPGAIHKSAYSKLHTKSEFCGICHSADTFNVFCSLVYDQHKEADPAGKIQCQDCHMKGTENMPAAISGQKKRTIHDHSFPGGRFDEMWREAIDMDLHAEQQVKGDILVTVKLRNKITHNIPDG